MPPLLSPRSSHDVAVVGNRLIVVGGWTLNGKEPTTWPDSMEAMDLTASRLEWKRIPQPFKRRALSVAALDGKVYVIGGFDDRSRIVHGVAVYDPSANAWSAAPDLPGGALSGFGPAACIAHGRLVASVDDGSLYRLGSQGWTIVGKTTPRIVHRCVEDGDRVLVLGGAHAGDNSDLVEAIAIAD